VDSKAFYKLSYGLFLLTTRDGDKDNGCIINTAIQCASDPLQMSVCVINKNYTCDLIKASGRFNVSVIPQSAPFKVFQVFGHQSGRNVDKFAECTQDLRLDNGIRYLPKANAVFACRVIESHDIGSHTVFIAEVEDARTLTDEPPMSYAYYQSDVKPKPTASASNKRRYVCRVCGYVYEGDVLPADYICPLCNHGAEEFELVEPKIDNNIKGEIKMKKFVCSVCGYVYEGDAAPAECPVCHVPAEKFNEVVGEMTLAAEHEYGIYAKTVKNNPDVSEEDKKYIFEQLMANFNGECSEVGMYLCMARIAHREGYPEIGLYWEKAAYEEAEHAAKFAELLGEDLEANMKASTKANLAWRVDCEYGATQGKVDLATCAKKNNLDAIHDTVHEMARDEARHGKALEGLLKRYFA